MYFVYIISKLILKLTLTLEEEIAILNRYSLTSSELFLLRVLLILQDENNEQLFSDYIATLKPAGIKLRDLLDSLQTKGIILKSYKIPNDGEEFNPYEIAINKNFIKNIYKCSFELGKELFDTYPQFTTLSNGSVVSLRGVSKHFDSLEDAYAKYGKYIKWNPELHSEIINLVKWAKDNNLICQSLSSFIINNAWHDLKAMKEGTNNINYNAIREL
jgi:hypothetical protein